MKIRIAKEDLEKSLRVVAGSSSRKEEEISSHYRFRYVGGRIEIATHVDRRFSYTLLNGATVEDPKELAFTVSCKRLDQLAEAAESGVIITLRYSESKKQTAISAGRGTIRLASKNPEDFPLWEMGVKGAEKTATLTASRLRHGYRIAKLFVVDDRTKPALSVVEFRDGALYGVDNVGAVRVQMPDTEGCTTRLHIRDLPSVSSFFAQLGNNPVEIWKGDRISFFKCEDSVMGCAEPRHSLSALGEAFDRPYPMGIKISCSEFQQAVKYLVAGADWTTNRMSLFLEEESEDGTPKLILSMKSSSLGEDDIKVSVSVLECIGENLLTERFPFHYPHLEKAIGSFSEDIATLGFMAWETSGGKAGCCMYLDEQVGAESSRIVIVNARR